ncbi:MAG: hypothetical protein ACYTJ0_19340 [Planctomycetota bacterium]|jgi:hypothetical protein
MARYTAPWSARRLAAWTLSLLAGAAVTGTAPGQGGRQMMVRDDGAEQDFVHFTMPDFQALREPDYRRSDLPIFEEKLRLDTTQRIIVKELIEQYLEQLTALWKEKLGPSASGPAVQVAEGADGGQAVFISLGGADREIDRLMSDTVSTMREAAGARSGEEVGGEVAVMIGTSIRVGGEGEGDDAPPSGGVRAAAPGEGEGPSVAIALSGPEGTELPESVRKELEKRAQEIAEKLQQQMAKQMAAGEGGGLGLPGPESMEEHRRNMEELADRAKELEKDKQRLGRQFVTDVQAQLTEEQIPLWPSLERKLTRIKTLPKGRLDGERTDLIAITEQMELTEDESAAIAETVEAYELTLHQALVHRNEMVPETQKKIDEALSEHRYDRALSLVDRATDARVRVRRVNEDFTDAIALALPEASAEAFSDEVAAASFPRVHRTTHGDRVFEVAQRIEALDEDTVAVIDELEQAYRLERQRVDDEIVRTIRREQPEEPKRGIEHMKSAMEGEPVEIGFSPLMETRTSATSDAFEKRRELDRKYRKLVEGLLTPEQAALLPQVPTHRGPVIIQSR